MSTSPTPCLVIEASTATGSLAVERDGACVSHATVTLGASRDDALLPEIIELLRDAGLSPSALRAIVVGDGPGSFTSLRIAAALAKGLAHAAAVPLFAVPSLLLAAGTHDTPGHYVVHADALRGERFAVSVTIDDTRMVRADGPVTRVAARDLDGERGGTRHLVVGEWTATDPWHAVTPNAAAVVRVDSWWMRGPVDLVTWEPHYGRLAEAQVQWELAHGRSLPLT